jgi:glutaredoxin
MKTKATFYHAGCPVCVSAEQSLTTVLDPGKIDLEIIHLGEQPQCIENAESAGVESVPALVLGMDTLHINFGAALADLKEHTENDRFEAGVLF